MKLQSLFLPQMAVNPSQDSILAQCYGTSETQEEEQQDYKRYEDLVSTLPLEARWVKPSIRLYHGFWIPEHFLAGLIAIREHFKPRASDILVASYPKSGSGWLRALTFSVVNRHSIPSEAEHPLHRMHAQRSAAFLERIFTEARGRPSELTVLPTPRLLATHAPYSLLLDLVKDSECKIIYICREPKDTLVSMWYFAQAMRDDNMNPLTLDEVREQFCMGKSPYGPIWDHHLEYWQESLRTKDRILFFKYEDLMQDPEGNLRKLGEFVGVPFSEAEERAGVVKEIVRLCSFENLRSLEVNNTGMLGPFRSSTFFRKGKVGDWMNHLNPPMAQKLDNIINNKLQGSGLCFT